MKVIGYCILGVVVLTFLGLVYYYRKPLTKKGKELFSKLKEGAPA